MVEHTENHSEAKLISQLYPDDIICMVSALFYYGYSDRTPINWDMLLTEMYLKQDLTLITHM